MPASARVRWIAVVACALAVVAGLVMAGGGLFHAGRPDTDAYWNAALRLREGQPLYLPADPNADDAYKYAPWFAWLWIPLTLLPREVAYAWWTVFLAACSLAAIAPVVRSGLAGLALGGLVGGSLIYGAGYGNPTPAIVAALTLSHVHPAVVGVAASIKVSPLLLSAGWIADRQWKKVLFAWTAAGLLWAPAVVYGLDGSIVSPGDGGISLWTFSPAVWAGVAAIVAGSTAWLALRGSPWTWLAAAAMIPLALPRTWLSDIAYLIVVVPLLRARLDGTSKSDHSRATTSPMAREG